MHQPTPYTREVVMTYLASFIMHLILGWGHSSLFLHVFKLESFSNNLQWSTRKEQIKKGILFVRICQFDQTFVPRGNLIQISILSQIQLHRISTSTPLPNSKEKEKENEKRSFARFVDFFSKLFEARFLWVSLFVLFLN